MTADGPSQFGLWWEPVEIGAQKLYFNSMYGIFSSSQAEAAGGNLKGALLAEEMGLGKVRAGQSHTWADPPLTSLRWEDNRGPGAPAASSSASSAPAAFLR